MYRLQSSLQALIIQRGLWGLRDADNNIVMEILDDIWNNYCPSDFKNATIRAQSNFWVGIGAWLTNQQIKSEECIEAALKERYLLQPDEEAVVERWKNMIWSYRRVYQFQAKEIYEELLNWR